MIVSYYKPGLCRYHLYFIVLHKIVSEMLPIDYGDVQLEYLLLTNVLLIKLHCFDYYKTIIIIIVVNLHSMVFVRSLIYQDVGFPKLIAQFFMATIMMTFYFTAIHMMQTWIGFQYVEAELPRESNERLLNNMQEGVFIVSEDNKEVLFQNTAANRIKINLESECVMSLTS